MSEDKHPADKRFEELWLAYTKQRLRPPGSHESFRMGWDAKAKEEESKWRPIEEAGKDEKTDFEILGRQGNAVYSCHWHSVSVDSDFRLKNGVWVDREGAVVHPTHFRHLPEVNQ